MRLGLDIGGTKIEAVILNNEGNAVYRKRYETKKQDYRTFLHTVVGIVNEARMACSAPLSIGLGIPGTVDRNGLIKNSNILVLNQEPFSQDLERLLESPVAITNDANCFTLSEAMDGSGKGHNIVFGIILGTGCGGGLCINNQLISGINSCAGEWGHNTLPRYRAEYDGDAVPCYCGQTNCIESFVSGSGLARQYFQHFSKHGNVPDIIAQVESGDVRAAQLWQRYRDQLARSLASIINTLDPDVIVVGGGVSNVKHLYPGLQALVGQYVFGRQCQTPIIQAQHGDSSGVRGAAWLGANMAHVPA